MLSTGFLTLSLGPDLESACKAMLELEHSYWLIEVFNVQSVD